jgi:hypothetical protein
MSQIFSEIFLATYFFGNNFFLPVGMIPAVFFLKKGPGPGAGVGGGRGGGEGGRAGHYA